jgi:alpha-tubulin suppressor-like RCC1 family protein
LSGITQIAAGRENYQSCYAVKSDGTLYSWGYNGDSQLGDNTTTNSTIAMPRSMGSLSGKTIVKVFAGAYHAMALDSLGNLHAWGTNSYGQLGNGNYALQAVPVIAVATGVADVYLGGYDYPVTYIKKTDGTLWACGYGEYWANGMTPAGTNSATFVQIPVGGTVVKAIRGGSGTYNYGAALLTNGTVKVWGYNGNGALGVGDTTVRASVNTMLTGNRLVTDICSVGYASEQGIALLMDDGQVWQVGYAGGSQLPEDDSESTWTPMPVVF